MSYQRIFPNVISNLYGFTCVERPVVTRRRAFVLQTSYSTLFALYHLARNPDKQRLLYDELQRLNPGADAATPRMLDDAKYLKAVIKENFRLNPVFPFVARMLTEDTVVRGYRIPAGVRTAACCVLNQKVSICAL